MNVRTLRFLKELRPLFWPWCVIALMAGPRLMHPQDDWTLGIWALGYFLGIPFLAALTFGNEFEHRTFSLLLSQPVGRTRIWGEKLSSTVFAVVSAVLVLTLALRATQFLSGMKEVHLAGAWVVASIAAGMYWTLVTRSTVGGAALTIAVQLFIFAAVDIVRGRYGIEYVSLGSSISVPAITLVFASYAGLMLWLGWRKLARFQTTGGMAGDDLLTAGPDALPSVLVGWLRSRPSGAFLNLVRKEIRLLRPVWLISLLAVAGWACLAALVSLTPRLLSREFETAVAGVAMISTLIVAILAGSLSLGEERTSGRHLWHLTLPVSAGSQWFIKLCMALFAGFAGAWLLPTLIVRATFLASRPAFEMFAPHNKAGLIVVLLLTFAAFWCACAVNGTVRAVLWVLPVMIAVYFAGEFGKWTGPELMRVFWFWFDPFTNVKFAHAVSHLWFNGFLQLIQSASNNMTDSVLSAIVLTLILLVPTLLYAVFQSYRLFRTQLPDRAWPMVRGLVSLALMAFLCNFLVLAFYTFVGRAAQRPKVIALLETGPAIEKFQSATPQLNASYPLQLTVNDLATASLLSKSTRRLLGDSHITLRREEPHHQGHFGCAGNPQPRNFPALNHSWYSATGSFADGSHFFVAFDPAARSIFSAGFCK